MVEYVVGVLRSVVDEVVVVTSADLEVPPLEAKVVRDEEPEQGPLAGLASGLAHVEAGLTYATSTDAPWLTAEFVRAVLAPGRAAAPRVDGFVQTLAAAYPTRAGEREARALLADGRRRPLDLLEALDYRAIDEDALPDKRSLSGFNTPDAYLAAVEADVGRATASIEFVGRPRTLVDVESLEVPIGTLAQVLSHVPASLEVCRGDRVAAPYLVSLGGREFVRDARIPVGAGERILVLDASAGGRAD